MQNAIEHIKNQLFPQLNLSVSNKTYCLAMEAEILKIQKKSHFIIPQEEADNLILSLKKFQLINQMNNSFEIATSDKDYYTLTVTFSREASLEIIKKYDITLSNEEVIPKGQSNHSAPSTIITINSFFSRPLIRFPSIKGEKIEENTNQRPCDIHGRLVQKITPPMESGKLASFTNLTPPSNELLARSSGVDNSNNKKQKVESSAAITGKVNPRNLNHAHDYNKEALISLNSFLMRILPQKGGYLDNESSSLFQENIFLQELYKQQKFRQDAKSIYKYLVDVQRQRFQDLFSKDSWHQSLQLVITILLLDAGRANSITVYPGRISLWGSPYWDPYHREAAKNQSYLTLVNFALIESENEEIYLVPFASHMINLVRLLLSRNEYIKNQDDITTQEFTFNQSDYKEQVHVVKIKKPVLKEALNILGRLGALRPRDWQLLCVAFNEGNNIHNFYSRLLTFSSYYYNELNTAQVKSIEGSITEKKEVILALLGKLKANYPIDVCEEQRSFYCQILIKFLKPILIQENLSADRYTQALSTLVRMEDLVLKLNNSSYLVFLRLTETIIDEVLVLLALGNQKKQFSASEHLNQLSKFINNTVGKIPDGVSLNASCMQGIWICFELSLNFFRLDLKRDSINFLIDKSCYFEVFIILESLFDGTDLKNDCQDVSLSLAFPDLSTTALSASKDIIYHLCISNFEANFKIDYHHMLYTDINAFIAKQMELREKEQIKTPLIMIIDCTMSEFDEPYLPDLLNQFKREIELGLLAVFVCHSGNKYLHLGTDKVPASLMYAYCNTTCFPHLINYFEQQVKLNKISDFNAYSPSLLLTSMLLEHAQEEILVYSKGIRQRTLSVYKYAIPESLKNSEEESSYFMFNNPAYGQSNNNCGFIVIRTSSKPVLEPPIYKYIVSFISDLMNELGIYNRDGFAFSHSTYIQFSSSTSTYIRISIGTEKLDDIIQKIKVLCGALLIINAEIASYQNACTEHSDLLPQDRLLDDIKSALTRKIIVGVSIANKKEVAPTLEDAQEAMAAICKEIAGGIHRKSTLSKENKVDGICDEIGNIDFRDSFFGTKGSPAYPAPKTGDDIKPKFIFL